MGLVTHPSTCPGGPERDEADFARLRQARERERGFPIGRYLQPPPMLFTRDGHNVFLGDLYRGRAAFLLCGGPSLGTHDLSWLNQRGILTLAVNNAAVVHRPQLWCCVDDPSHFADAIWRDPGILKFAPLCHMEKPVYVRDAGGALVPGADKVGDMPAVFGFRRNEAFAPEQWLHEDTFNWGNHSNRTDGDGQRGSRSVMYVALRLLYFLGVRRVYLLGCDFRMQFGGRNYAFEQDRSAASVRSNNQTYRILNRRLERLRPYFEGAGFVVRNCTPQSGLTVFPSLSYDDAVAEATAEQPARIDTAGMYDRTAQPPPAPPPPRVVMPQPWRSSAAGSHKPVETAEPAARPATTLIVPVEGRDLAEFPRTWRNWIGFHPWLRTLPTILVSRETGIHEVDLGENAPGDLRRELLPSRRATEIDRLGEELSAMLPWLEGCRTPWWLKLDADARGSEPTRPWPAVEWFASPGENSPPVLIGHRWGTVRTGRYLARLDAWAARHAGHPTAASFFPEVPRTDERVTIATLSSWCLLGRTDWLPGLAGGASGGLPDVPLPLFLQYCATRLGHGVTTVDMKAMGWTHSFSPRRTESPRGAATVAARDPEFAAVDAGAVPGTREVAPCPR